MEEEEGAVLCVESDACRTRAVGAVRKQAATARNKSRSSARRNPNLVGEECLQQELTAMAVITCRTRRDRGAKWSVEVREG